MLFTFVLVQHLQVHIHAKGLPNLTQIWKSGMEGWFPGCEKPHCANMAGTTNLFWLIGVFWMEWHGLGYVVVLCDVSAWIALGDLLVLLFVQWCAALNRGSRYLVAQPLADLLCLCYVYLCFVLGCAVFAVDELGVSGLALWKCGGWLCSSVWLVVLQACAVDESRAGFLSGIVDYVVYCGLVEGRGIHMWIW
ncbi:hypothetical protein ACSQ67_000915 [Phaseolus vulgaris]